jgi:hypothetical protein
MYYIYSHLEYFVGFWYIYSRFGLLNHEKSGNPASEPNAALNFPCQANICRKKFTTAIKFTKYLEKLVSWQKGLFSLSVLDKTFFQKFKSTKAPSSKFSEMTSKFLSKSQAPMANAIKPGVPYVWGEESLPKIWQKLSHVGAPRPADLNFQRKFLSWEYVTVSTNCRTRCPRANRASQ